MYDRCWNSTALGGSCVLAVLRSNTRLEHIAAQTSLMHKKRLFSLLIQRYQCPCARLGGTWGSRNIAPSILNRGSRWMLEVSIMPRLLYTRLKSPLYIFYCKGGGPRRRSGRLGDKKSLSLLLVIHVTSSKFLVTISTAVTRLSGFVVICHLCWSNLSESATYCP